MTTDLSYLKELGYSYDEIQSYQQSWADGILSFLSENQTYVLENMRFLQNDFDADLLLKLPVFYPEAFALAPQDFQRHLQKLQSAFQWDWKDIIENQFWGYDGADGKYMKGSIVFNQTLYEPFLETMGTNDEKKIAEALQSLQDPTSRIYKFIVMLRLDAGIDLTPQDFPEDCLLFLEVCKYELQSNVNFMQNKHLPESVLIEIFASNPMLLCGSELELEESLKSVFGDDYVQTMSELPIEQIDEMLLEI